MKNSTLLQVNSLHYNELSRVEESKPDLTGQSMDIEGLKNEFFNYMSSRSENTLREYDRAIIRLYEFMNNNQLRDFSDIKDHSLEAYQGELYKRGYSAVTIYYDLKALRRYCDILIRLGLVDSNPFKDIAIISRPASTRKGQRYYSHHEAMRRYLNYTKKNFYYRTYIQYRNSLRSFIRFLEERSIKSICSVTFGDISGYTQYLWDYRGKMGRCYTVRTIGQKLRHLKSFYKFFYVEDIIDTNPTKKLNISRFLRELAPDTRPRSILAERNNRPFDKLFIEYKNYLMTKNYSKATIQGYRRNLSIFFDWLGKKDIARLEDITKKVIFEYYTKLNSYQGDKGKVWSNMTQYRHLVALRKFSQFLFRYDYIISDPTASLEMPKKEQGLPMTCMSDTEARRILDAAYDSKKAFALRDRAIFELLYSSAIRSSELCHLNVDDIDFDDMYVRVRHAKGGRSFERVVPFGKLAHRSLKDYLALLRPKLAVDNIPILFLSQTGKKLTNNSVCRIVKEYAMKAGIKRRITTHSWRVGCATELLKEGVDIRYVQEQLGHRSLESTKQYVRLIPKDLKKMHNLYHPREKYYRMTCSKRG